MGTFSRENNSTSKLNPWYITGFCEGEATFTFNRGETGMTVVFGIKLTAKEEPILIAIRNFFGNIGNIYKVKPLPPTKNSGYTKEARYFKVHAIADLEDIVAHFEKYPLRGAKQRQFLVWKEMVELKKNFRKPDREKLEILAQKLSALSPRNQLWQ